MRIKEPLKTGLALLIRLLCGNNRIVWLSPLLFLYAFALLVAQHIVDELYSDRTGFNKWYLIPLGSFISIEILNQITYKMTKRYRDKAIRVKAVLFWLLFTITCISLIIIKMCSEKTGTWFFSNEIPTIILAFCISWILPAYSFCPDFRFYVLYGKFEKKW